VCGGELELGETMIDVEIGEGWSVCGRVGIGSGKNVCTRCSNDFVGSCEV